MRYVADINGGIAFSGCGAIVRIRIGRITRFKAIINLITIKIRIGVFIPLERAILSIALVQGKEKQESDKRCQFPKV